jgi:hypothetical protein
MNDEPNQVQPNKPNGNTKSPALGLILAFVPSVIVLSTITFGADSLLKKTPDATGRVILWAACFASVVCCFVASFVLFRRKTAYAVFGGIVFLFLNAVISFLFGCAASWHGL